MIQSAQAYTIGTDWHMGTNDWCAVDTGGKNTFYLCGDDGSGNKLQCDDWDYRSFWGHSRKWYGNNQDVTLANKTYTCCIPEGSQVGSFKEYKRDKNQ